MNWWALLFEMLGFSLLGVLYYLFQKRRILKNFESDIDFVTEDIILLTNQSMEQHSNQNKLKWLELAMERLQKDRQSFLTEQDYLDCLNHETVDGDLKAALVNYRSILLNRFEKK